jgi:hypothetical protein
MSSEDNQYGWETEDQSQKNQRNNLSWLVDDRDSNWYGQ